MRPLLAWAASSAASLMLILASGCASPPTRFYTLSVNAEAPPAGTASRLSIAVGPVTIPAVVDRPQMVTSVSTNHVRLDEFNRWAAPLAEEITRVTVGNLSQLLSGAQVWPGSAANSPQATVKLRIDVLNFEARAEEAVLIDVRWSVSGGQGTQYRRSQLREPTRGPGADALAAAYSRALGRMAVEIAAELRAP